MAKNTVHKVLHVQHNYVLQTTTTNVLEQELIIKSTNVTLVSTYGNIFTYVFKGNPCVNVGDEITIVPNTYPNLVDQNLTQKKILQEFVERQKQ